MSKAGSRLIQSAREAAAIARGEKAPARLFVPPDLDIRAIRAKTDLSQEDFATTFGFTISQIRDWEQLRSRPTGGVRAYLMLIDENPDAIVTMLKQASATHRSAA